MTSDIRTGSLIDFVPEVIADDPEIIALSHALDTEIRDIAADVVEAIIWPRVSSQPEAVLDAMGEDVRLAELRLWDLLTVAEKRTALTGILRVRKLTGTRYSVRRLLDLLGLVTTIVEWWQANPHGVPYTYQVTVDADATTVGYVTLARLAAASEVLSRFAPARANLKGGAINVEVSSSGAFSPRPVLTVGHLTTIAFGGTP